MAWSISPSISAVVPYTGAPQSFTAIAQTTSEVFVGPPSSTLSVVTQPSVGRISLSADRLTAALDLMGATPAVGDTITGSIRAVSGSTTLDYDVTWTVAATVQDLGWHDGRHHLLPIANGQVVISTEGTHRKVYMSPTGKTAATIATEQSVTEGTVTGAWLAANHPAYGATEAEALETSLAYDLWTAINPRGSSNSNWLLLERGGSYAFSQLFPRESSGHSVTSPKYVGAYGTGAQPEIALSFIAWQNPQTDLLFEDVTITSGSRMEWDLVGTQRIMAHKVSFQGNEVSAQGFDYCTFVDCEFYDAARDAPVTADWTDAFTNRKSGMYAADMSSLLVDNCHVDRGGWDGDWTVGDDPEDPTTPHPPSLFSHNFYFAASAVNATLRNTVLTRASSFGSQLRGGAVVHNTAYVANPVALNAIGGDYLGAGPEGNYSRITDILITAGDRPIPTLQGGGTRWAFSNVREDVILSRAIVAHVNDPDDGAYTDGVLWDSENNLQLISDLLVYRWKSDEENIPGLDTADLDAVSIEDWAVGKSLTRSADAYCDWLRTLTPDQRRSELDALQGYFRAAFGLPVKRTTSATCQFAPFDPGKTGDGVRWDNPLNWSTGDIPGANAGDAVQIGGCRVIYCDNSEVASIDLDDGILVIAGGRLTVGSVTGSGTIITEGAGDLDATTVAAGVTVTTG